MKTASKLIKSYGKNKSENLELFCSDMMDKGAHLEAGDKVLISNEEFVLNIINIKDKLPKIIEKSIELNNKLETIDSLSKDVNTGFMESLSKLYEYNYPDALKHIKEIIDETVELFSNNEESVVVPGIVEKGLSKVLNKSWELDSKNENDERFIFGVVLEPNDGSDGFEVKPDADNDIYSADEVRKAAHWFMENGRKSGLLHGPSNGGEIFPIETDRVVIVENYVSLQQIPENYISENSPMIKKGTWLMGLRINDDDIWRSIKAGKLNGLSIGGIATEVEPGLEVEYIEDEV